MGTNNVLLRADINEFKALYKKRFNKDLSDQEATYRANNLFNLYIAVYSSSNIRKAR